MQILMTEARRLQNTGDSASAAQHYLQILETNPNHFEARLLLGTMYSRLGRMADAIVAMQKALDTRPDDPIALQACGALLIQMGRFADAIGLFDRALALRPDALPFLFNRALALALSGRSADALSGYDQAIALRPNFIEAWLGRGNLLRQLGRLDDALASFNRALACDADNLAAHHVRGLLLAQMGQPAQALVHFDRVLDQQPHQAELLLERGHMLRKLGRLAEALQSYDAALALAPGDDRLWNARGTVMMDMRRPDDALSAYNQAIVHNPASADSLTNRGLLQWTRWRRYDEAIADLSRAADLLPRQSRVRGELLHLRMYAADWQNFPEQKALLDEGVRSGHFMLQPFAYQALSDSPADLAVCARTFARLYPYRPSAPHSRRSDGRIRIGYVSENFRDHATAYLMAGLYEAHDREKFEIVAFDNGHDDGSALRRRQEAAMDGFVDIPSLSDDAAASRIRAEGIDILVNLNGYFGADRMGIFARRPAPIQVNYLGFPGTLGAAYIDYLIADRTVIPPEEYPLYDEKIVTLPGCYQANDARRAHPEAVANRAACCLPEDTFVFCNFNQSYKLTPKTFAAWMRIMAAVPNSVLWLLDNLPALQTNLKQQAIRHGVTADRIIFAPNVPIEQHLARLPQADLFLDSLPYNAHTTASDALWMGVPLVTCRGKTFPGRVAASMLAAAGMEELVTETIADFEGLAVALATDRDRLRALREKLAANRLTCALFDTARFTRNIETAYRTMHARWLAGEAPAAFSIDA